MIIQNANLHMIVRRGILALLLVFTYFVGVTQIKVVWTCPMHPQIQKEKAGNCPICGITLVKKTVKLK